eukprot:gene3862-15159_t
MSRKTHSNEKHAGRTEKRLGPVEELKDPVEKSNKQMLKAISEILDSKLASLATKDDVTDLKDIINQQRLKIEMLEAKVVLIEKYEQRIVGLEKRASKNNCEIDAASERIKKLVLRTDENESYHRRLCLRINGVELSLVESLARNASRRLKISLKTN